MGKWGVILHLGFWYHLFRFLICVFIYFSFVVFGWYWLSMVCEVGVKILTVYKMARMCVGLVFRVIFECITFLL